MKIQPFKLERYFDKYEFKTQYLLSSSDCDGYSLEYVVSCANEDERKLWDTLKLGYTESQGSPLLRNTIAKQYRTIGESDVLVLSPGEANFILMNVVLEPGDHVICMSPAYQSLYQVALDIGATVSFWTPENDGSLHSHQGWHYDPKDLEGLVRENTKLIIVNFPHNPTGFLPTRKEVDEIAAIAAKKNIVLFSDEMYSRMAQDPADDIPSLCDLYDNAVSLWGMAKSFGLAGLRIGWIATKNTDILKSMLSFKDYLTICNNAMSEVLTVIALNHQDKFVVPNVAKIKRNIAAFDEFARNHSDMIEFRKPVAGSTSFIKLHVKESALNYCERMVKQSGIMLLPSEMFEYGSTHARIGLGRENMPEVLERWGEYIKKS
ncbi:MAG TPA: aminotransferase class I/II-fold pyridoxal phosphate-dependent enzyme [Cyclobacteriaceae bacterium]|nr:aminotransferase class I/II-fold pyridoxal phosphate-dependent enzyme [Cyclobacteriaceae bacterium]